MDSWCAAAPKRGARCWLGAGAKGVIALPSKSKAGKASLPREKRLHGATLFREVFEKGLRLASPSFVFVVLKIKSAEKKFGISVHRKVGSAVTRNRIKRWIREVYRLNQERFAPGFHLVIRVREKLQLKNFRDAERELLGLFRRAGILK